MRLASALVAVALLVGCRTPGGGTPLPDTDPRPAALVRSLYDEVVPIVANRIAEAGGGIHCYTQQIPK